jgi:putative endonuclease
MFLAGIQSKHFETILTKVHTYYVYILASKRNGTLYTGVTNNLLRRVIEHKEKVIKGFTSKYNADKLVYYEVYKYINDAIKRESDIKAWQRKWKLKLIEENNIEWKDLLYEIASEEEINELKKIIKETYITSGFQLSLE